MQPLQFTPILKRIRWGGRRLGTVLRKDIGVETDWAESWELSDHGEDQSVVISGSLAGWSLQRLVRELGEDLCGAGRSCEQFPLLVKFLDAQDRLSVQVHPNDEQAKRFDPSENGKTEAWVILEANADSQLYAGLKQGTSAETLRQLLATGQVEECLHSFPVSPGDCVFIPAGTVHAISEGILLAEIQQSSDLTFRLYDWGRLGADGNPRELHIEEAISVIDFDRGPIQPVSPEPIAGSDGVSRELLVKTPYFAIERWQIPQQVTFQPENRFHIWMALAGQGVCQSDGVSQSIHKGDTILLPAACEEVRLEAAQPLTLLNAYVP